jgi:hypothetical protein
MADTKRCGWGVTGLIPGKGWGGIQCDGIENHDLIVVNKGQGPERFDHGNETFIAYWNEDHENASTPDSPFVPVLAEKLAPVQSGTFLIFYRGTDGSENALAVADDETKRDAWIEIYNTNRHSDRAQWCPVLKV